jgi:hypothetical protein
MRLARRIHLASCSVSWLHARGLRGINRVQGGRVMKSARGSARLVALLAVLFAFAVVSSAAYATGGKGDKGDKGAAHGQKGDDSERRSDGKQDRVKHEPQSKGGKGDKGGSYKEDSKGEDREKDRGDHKHTICHATGSSSNPYVMITPSVSGVYHGHIGHQGGEDIIPPFTYKGTTYSQNWGGQGAAIFAAGCKVAAPQPVDACPNLSGHQDKVPPGYEKDASGNCVLKQKEQKPDVCPNLEGQQGHVPTGFVKDAQGNCVRDKVDVCPNLEGQQGQVPTGFMKDANGNCVKQTTTPTDVCPNLEGMQTEVPAGMVKDASGNCVNQPAAAVTPPATPTPAPATPAPATPAPATPAPAAPAPAAAAPAGDVAGAESPTSAESDEQPASGVLGEVSPEEAVAETATSGTLPFTGLPLWVAALLGIALLGTGLVLRRASQH